MRSDPPIQSVSATRLRDFLACRRRGRFEEFWASNTFEGNLFFGIAIHDALEAYYRFGRRLDPMLDAYAKYCQAAAKGYEQSLGYLWAESFSEFDQLYKLGWEVLKNYAEFDSLFPIDGEPIWIEKRLTFEIPDSGGMRLSGQIDALFRDVSGGLWVVDHKTSARGIDSSACDVDEQLTAYAYLVYRETGRIPQGIIYNTILKQSPDSPVPLVRGGFSKAKDQKTTPSIYRATLKSNGLDEAPYIEFLEYLEKNAWGKFFQREVATRNLTELLTFEKYVGIKIADIRRSIDGPQEVAYPAPSIYQCGYCPFIAPCKAMNDGGDHLAILSSKFKRIAHEKTPDSLIVF